MSEYSVMRIQIKSGSSGFIHVVFDIGLDVMEFKGIIWP